MADQGHPGWVQDPDGNWHQRVEQAPTSLPQHVPSAPKKKQHGCLTVALIIIAVVVVLTIIGGTAGKKNTATNASAPGAPTTVADDANDQSSLACNHFRNIMGDVQQGILTDAELRSKLTEVKDDAIIGTPAVKAASVHMLSAMTTGTTDELLTAVGEMAAACTASGN